MHAVTFIENWLFVNHYYELTPLDLCFYPSVLTEW